MRGIKSIIARGAVCLAVLSGSASFALACGNPLIYPLLFRAYSEAGRAYDAERAARQRGELSAAVWSAELDLTYHEWSLMRARRVLDRLAVRLHQAAEAEAGRADFTVSIMLANEVYLARLHTNSRTVALQPFNMGHPKGNINLYTTANALRTLINGRMRWQDAIKQDLIVLASPGHQQEKVNRVLSKAFSGSKQGDRSGDRNARQPLGPEGP